VKRRERRGITGEEGPPSRIRRREMMEGGEKYLRSSVGKGGGIYLTFLRGGGSFQRRGKTLKRKPSFRNDCFTEKGRKAKVSWNLKKRGPNSWTERGKQPKLGRLVKPPDWEGGEPSRFGKEELEISRIEGRREFRK